MDNLHRLEHASKAPGVAALHIVTLPFPRAVMMNGERLPASYANFYIANDVVVMPTFNDPNDRVALDILANLMPSRTVVGIHAVDLVWGLGTLHCLTQQEPLRKPVRTCGPMDDGAGASPSRCRVRGPIRIRARPDRPSSHTNHAPALRRRHRAIASDTLNAAPGIATPAIS